MERIHNEDDNVDVLTIKISSRIGDGRFETLDLPMGDPISN